MKSRLIKRFPVKRTGVNWSCREHFWWRRQTFRRESGTGAMCLIMNAGTSTSQVSPCFFNGPIVAAIVAFYQRKSRRYGTVSARIGEIWSDRRIQRLACDCNGAARRGLGITGNSGPRREAACSPKGGRVFDAYKVIVLIDLKCIFFSKQFCRRCKSKKKWRFHLAQCFFPLHLTSPSNSRTSFMNCF